MVICLIGKKQDFKYSGKEYDSMHGLNQYDYAARYYDPAYSRFTTMDPRSEKYYSYSPYAYVMNNPMKFIDPDGRDYWSNNDPELIKQFFNAMGSGTNNADLSGWNHASDSEFLGNATFNDETGKLYTSYGTVENGEATIIGVSFDTNIKPSIKDGHGYKGAFVYQYENTTAAWFAQQLYGLSIVGFFTDFNPVNYTDRSNTTWALDHTGRIIGLQPITGTGPLPGRQGGKNKIFKGGKQSSRDSSLNRYLKDFAKWYHREVKGNSRGDATAEQLAEWYLEWINLGKPLPK